MDKKNFSSGPLNLYPYPPFDTVLCASFETKIIVLTSLETEICKEKVFQQNKSFELFFFSSLNFYGKTFSVKVVAVVILHTQLNLEASKINSLKVSEFNYIFNCWPFKYFFELSRKKSRSKTCRGYDRQTGPWVSFYFSNFFLEFWHFEICKENGACFDLFLDLTEKSLLNKTCKGH